MPCEKYFQLEREYESACNEQRLFKTPFGAGGTKKQRERVSQSLKDDAQKALIAFTNHQKNCEECKKGLYGNA
jgi:hypothetical protein